MKRLDNAFKGTVDRIMFLYTFVMVEKILNLLTDDQSFIGLVSFNICFNDQCDDMWT